MRYEPMDPMSREDAEAAIARADPEELTRVVLAVALHADDGPWASAVCLQLARHSDFNVRGNAILGLGPTIGAFGEPRPAEYLGRYLRSLVRRSRAETHLPDVTARLLLAEAAALRQDAFQR